MRTKSRRDREVARRVSVEVAAARLAAEHGCQLSFELPERHALGWAIHAGWSRGVALRMGHDRLLRTWRAEVGYLARQIICGDKPDRGPRFPSSRRRATPAPLDGRGGADESMRAWIRGFATGVTQMHGRLLRGADAQGVRDAARSAGLAMRDFEDADVPPDQIRMLRRAGVPTDGPDRSPDRSRDA